MVVLSNIRIVLLSISIFLIKNQYPGEKLVEELWTDQEYPEKTNQKNKSDKIIVDYVNTSRRDKDGC